MNIVRNSFPAVYTAVEDYCDETKQSVLSLALRMKELRMNPDFFHKVCEVTYAIFQLLTGYCPQTQDMSKLMFAFSSINTHYFLNFMRMPRKWFFPVNSSDIKDIDVASSLERKLCDHFNVGYSNPAAIRVNEAAEVVNAADNREDDDVEAIQLVPHQREYLGNNEMRSIAEQIVEGQLTEMARSNDAYRTTQEFEEVLQRRIRSTQIKEEGGRRYLAIENNGRDTWRANTDIVLTQNYDFSNMDLSGLSVPLAHISIGDKVNSFMWDICNLLVVGIFFQMWNVIDTAKWANTIGQYPLLGFVKVQTLEVWVCGVSILAFAMNFWEVNRKLFDEQLTQEQIRNAKWDRMIAFFEIVYNGSGLLNSLKYTQSGKYIYVMAILAKGLGAVNIATKPRHKYFQLPVAAPAAWNICL